MIDPVSTGALFVLEATAAARPDNHSRDRTPINRSDLTAQAVAGYLAAPFPTVEEAIHACPYFHCSSAGLAWLVGVYFQRTGRSAPTKVRMARGYHVHASGMRVDMKNVDRPTVI